MERWIHQCIAALKRVRLKNASIVIEPMAEVIAEGNIASFYKNGTQTRYGVSGTLGDNQFTDIAAKMLNTKQIVKMPRAQRPHLAEANWPLIANGEGGYNASYNRMYRFAPIIAETHVEHNRLLIDMIGRLRENNQSAIVFFNTIAECEDFHVILRTKYGSSAVQIFDDTKLDKEEVNAGENGLKRSQKTSILHASSPRMITLTTAAGSRGADFNAVDVGIIAKPGLSRVIYQKCSRIGRNAQFGMVYEVYSNEELVDSAQQLSVNEHQHVEPKQPDYNRANLRFKLDNTENSLQEDELAQLEARQPIDEFKDQVQNEYAKISTKKSSWPSFFGSLQNQDLERAKHAWEAERENLLSGDEVEAFEKSSSNSHPS